MTNPAPMQITLKSGERRTKAAGWYIASTDVGIWLEEICRWNVPLDEIRLLIMPTSRTDQRPAGVLAIPDDEAVSAVAAHVSARAHPYQCLAKRLYIPTDAALWPPIDDAVLRALLVWEVNVLHPGIGLVGCRRSEPIDPAALLQSVSPTAKDWSVAEPGIDTKPKIVSVRPAVTPQMEAFLQTSADGIGENNPDDLPTLPHESNLRQAIMKASLGGLASLNWMGEKLGSKKSSPTPSPGSITPGSVGRMMEWLAAKQAALQAKLQEARQAEVARLMKLLESDPDQGLRYALPVNNQISHRGVAAPSARLGMRDVNFSARRMGSSQPGDSWQLNQDAHRKLVTRYRELASREIALGRHRRAAYVFAHLLGDFDSAAAALKQGKFHREAAMLYLDRLRKPLLAAECLELGGHLHEAVEIYLEHHRHEHAGDLLSRLGDTAAAAAQYRAAVKQLQVVNDTLAAAVLLEEKLNVPDEALAVLHDTWPTRPQARKCLVAWFELCGRLQRHEQAAGRLWELRRGSLEAADVSQLASVLADVATVYPHVPTRELAADITRIVVGRRLAETPAPNISELDALLAPLTRTAPLDQLLRRDARRFGDLRRVTELPLKPTRGPTHRPSVASAKGANKVDEFQFDLSLRLWDVVSGGDRFYALGANLRDKFTIRGNWNGNVEKRRWAQGSGSYFQARLTLINNRQLAVIHPLIETDKFQEIASVEFPATVKFPDLQVPALPLFAPKQTVAAAGDEEGRYWFAHKDPGNPNELAVTAFNLLGELTISLTVPLCGDFDRSQSESIFIAVRAGMLCVVAGTHMYVHSISRWLPPLTLPDLARSLSVSPPHTRLRMAISFDEGGAIYWPGTEADHRFGRGTERPKTLFTPDGSLIVAGSKQAMRYQISGTGVAVPTVFVISPGKVIGVTKTNSPDRVAFFYETGLVEVYKLA